MTIEEWQQFFINIYPLRNIDDTSFISILDPITDASKTSNEICLALKELETDKAPEKDQNSNLFLKFLPSNW